MGRKEHKSFWEPFQLLHENVKRSDGSTNEILLTDARKCSYLGFQKEGMVVCKTEGKIYLKESIQNHCKDLDNNFSLFRYLK